MSEIKKTAMVAVVGRPNVGKSTMTNALVGEKVAIVSPKPQTTRNRICGVVNRGETQYVLIDTPGLHRARNRLGEYMVRVARQAVGEVDVVCLLVEPVAKVGDVEQELIDRIKGRRLPAVLVINKIDEVEKGRILEVMGAYAAVHDFEAIIPISARKRDGLEELLAELEKYAVEGPQLYPDGQTTDQPERQMVGELVREKVLRNVEKEVPHGVAVEVTKFSQRDSGLIDVEVTVYCEKESHKGILIGKKGAMLKKLGSEAREEIEKYMGEKVNLQMWVKVKENWRENRNYVRNFGYREE